MSFVSIIVSAWNRPELLGRFFEDLSKTTYPYELIVHDDGSQVDTQMALIGLLRKGTISSLILNPTGYNRGHGTSVNRAANISEGDYIVKLNGDETFAVGWLETAVKTMEMYPEIGILHLAHYYSKAEKHDPIGRVVWDVEPFVIHKENRGIPLNIVWAGPGCAFMVRKKEWTPWVNTYNPSFGEDVEFRLRMCPMMRSPSDNPNLRPGAPKDFKAHWEEFKNTPWLALTDPPVVSYHPGAGLCSIYEAQKTLQKGPHIICKSS